MQLKQNKLAESVNTEHPHDASQFYCEVVTASMLVLMLGEAKEFETTPDSNYNEITAL